MVSRKRWEMPLADIAALITARFDTSPILTGKLRDTALDEHGKVVRGNYLLLFSTANPDELVTDRHTKPQTVDDVGRWEWTVRAVAVDPDGVRLLLREAFTLLVGWRPIVAGRRPSKVKHEGAEPIRPDRSLGSPLYFGEDDYSMRC